MVNPKVTNIAVPALNGGFVAILLSQPGGTSRIAIQEDPMNAGFGQGLVGYYVDPSIATANLMAYYTAQAYTAAQVLAALQALGAVKPNALQKWLLSATAVGQAYQPVQLGDWLRVHEGFGEFVGGPGECVLLVTSATAVATGIIISEWK